MAGKNPIKFTDTTFRDGHQSLLATRMRTEDIVPFMERMDQMGYWAIEVWGGRHLRHHPPLPGRRPLGAHPHHQGDPQEDPHHDAACAARTWWATATTPTT